METEETKPSYIQATPGFHIVRHDHDLEDPDLKLKAYLTPIIGWKIKGGWEGRDSVIPVCVSGSDEENPIVYPDGRVVRLKRYSNFSLFDSIEIWLEHETKRLEESTRRKKEWVERNRKDKTEGKNG